MFNVTATRGFMTCQILIKSSESGQLRHRTRRLHIFQNHENVIRNKFNYIMQYNTQMYEHIDITTNKQWVLMARTHATFFGIRPVEPPRLTAIAEVGINRRRTRGSLRLNDATMQQEHGFCHRCLRKIIETISELKRLWAIHSALASTLYRSQDQGKEYLRDGRIEELGMQHDW